MTDNILSTQDISARKALKLISNYAFCSDRGDVIYGDQEPEISEAFIKKFIDEIDRENTDILDKELWDQISTRVLSKSCDKKRDFLEGLSDYIFEALTYKD